MDPKDLEALLRRVQSGDATVDEAVASLRDLPFADLGFAKVDHHRALRQGAAEVVLAQGKSADQVVAIVKEIDRHGQVVLVTRLSPEQGQVLQAAIPEMKWDAMSRTAVLARKEIPNRGRGTIAVVSAGTADMPVAEEAAITATVLGNKVERVYDVGVSGLHRVLSRKDTLTSATAIIVVAGMEGALPSVVGGLVSRPVIAVPTSVGYGASFGGIAALLGMLNSCASGVTVVNIDNGFGAGFAASLINRAET